MQFSNFPRMLFLLVVAAVSCTLNDQIEGKGITWCPSCNHDLCFFMGALFHSLHYLNMCDLNVSVLHV